MKWSTQPLLYYTSTCLKWDIITQTGWIVPTRIICRNGGLLVMTATEVSEHKGSVIQATVATDLLANVTKQDEIFTNLHLFYVHGTSIQ